MKFDFCIGNPPYQEEATGSKLSDETVFHYFLDASFDIAAKVEMIHPARFLFNGGKTPKEWNEKMLNDNHFKVLDYNLDSKNVFHNTDIKGGVAITYRDEYKNFGAIKTFAAFSELNSILKKVMVSTKEYFDSIVFAVTGYKFTNVMFEEHPNVKANLSSGNERMIASNVFGKFENVIFFRKKPNDGREYMRMYGKLNNERVYMWIDKRYVFNDTNIEKWKVFVPAANGSGALGEVVSTPVVGQPVVGQPVVGHTQTFISIGSFETEKEALACLKYIKTKFARTLIGTLKVTQNGQKHVYRNVPLQDFTDKSDIDWTKSVHEIDLQLYRKYGLSDEEIQFIEEKVKAME